MSISMYENNEPSYITLQSINTNYTYTASQFQFSNQQTQSQPKLNAGKKQQLKSNKNGEEPRMKSIVGKILRNLDSDSSKAGFSQPGIDAYNIENNIESVNARKGQRNHHIDNLKENLDSLIQKVAEKIRLFWEQKKYLQDEERDKLIQRLLNQNQLSQSIFLKLSAYKQLFMANFECGLFGSGQNNATEPIVMVYEVPIELQLLNESNGLFFKDGYNNNEEDQQYLTKKLKQLREENRFLLTSIENLNHELRNIQTTSNSLKTRDIYQIPILMQIEKCKPALTFESLQQIKILPQNQIFNQVNLNECKQNYFYIDNIYEIPIQLVVQDQLDERGSFDIQKGQTSHFATQTEEIQIQPEEVKRSENFRNLGIKLVTQFSYIKAEQNTQKRAKRKPREQLNDYVEQQQQSSAYPQLTQCLQNSKSSKNPDERSKSGNDQSGLNIKQQIQMLFQSESISRQQSQPKQKNTKVIDDSYQITYKANIPFVEQESSRVNQNNSYRQFKSNQFDRESLLFVEFNNILQSPSEQQKNSLPNIGLESEERNKKIEENQFKLISRQNSKIHSSQNDHQLQINLQSSNQQFSLNIHGISAIGKIRENSQQSNSQINEYLQMYKFPDENSNSNFQSKIIQGMKKDSFVKYQDRQRRHEEGQTLKARDNKNRSLGTYFNQQSKYHLHDLENIIQERCNSQQSKSRRTTTKKSLNPNGYNQYDGKIDEEQSVMEKEVNYMMMRKRLFPNQKVHNYQKKRKDQYSRELELGNHLFLQKSLILQANKEQENEKKKAKQRLSEHPYLQYDKSSEIQQLSQLKGSSILKGEKKIQQNEAKQEPRKKFSFQQSSILLNFNNTSEAQQSKQINGNGLLGKNKHGGIVHLNTDFESEKKGHQVYIIDGETSSEGSRANREMKISELKNSFNEGSRKKSSSDEKMRQNFLTNFSNLRESVVDLSQYYEIRERMSHLEEQKSILIQKLNESQIKVQYMKKQTIGQQENLAAIEQHFKQKLTKILQHFGSYDEKLGSLQMQLRQKSKKNEQLAAINSERQKKLRSLQNILSEKQDEIKLLLEQLRSLEQNNQKCVKRISQQDQSFEQFKAEHFILKQDYQIQIYNLKQDIKERQKRIEVNTKEIQKSYETIQHLKCEYNEIMNNLQVACREREDYYHQLSTLNFPGNQFRQDSLELLYEGQFMKLKQSYGKEIDMKNHKIQNLQLQIIELNKEMKELGDLIEKMGDGLGAKQKQIRVLEEQLKSKDRFELSEHIEDQLDYLRKELVASAREIQYKQQIISRLEQSLKRYEGFNSQYERTIKRSRKCSLQRSKSDNKLTLQQLKKSNSIDHMSNQKLFDCINELRNGFPIQLQTTTSIINPTMNSLEGFNFMQLREKQQKILQMSIILRQKDRNIEELSKITLNYEEILLHNQQIIKELQDKICEFLEDAIQTQRENQTLYKQIENRQAQINQTLLDKIGLQIENKRMKKLIAASEKKISAIGSRLIHAAKDKIRIKDEISSAQISQNSTIKLRQLRLE